MIFVSTGAYSGVSLFDAAKTLLDKGFANIELSGCRWSSGDMDALLRLRSPNLNFQPHNYFPSQETPFVLNLASLNETINEQSLRHCERGIKLSKDFGQKYFSVHAGFLIDPQVEELGKTISKRKLNNRDLSIEKFINNINYLSNYASQQEVRILIENNVLNQSNVTEFQSNPLLMVDPQECFKIMNEFSGSVGMLLDVAHLKVSANSLNFLPGEVMKQCRQFIEGYHLSDNNGLVDENKPFCGSSWFWDFLKPNIDYISIEVYTHDFTLLKDQLNLVEFKLKEVK